MPGSGFQHPYLKGEDDRVELSRQLQALDERRGIEGAVADQGDPRSPFAKRADGGKAVGVQFHSRGDESLPQLLHLGDKFGLRMFAQCDEDRGDVAIQISARSKVPGIPRRVQSVLHPLRSDFEVPCEQLQIRGRVPPTKV